ncbi:BTAD domain-containing putative transcriptional regulator [Streptomyces sp. NPDC012693]|jgi:DNA-binding SARP family transcriptional activator/Flp pilus assembly protein TadD|uniref:AfsR/SARP family transcriptional regulator n=1 Tax=unclassified Streptomyces TaxID=2593676 RepID=UPI00202E0B01|nr:BTAD domain-containing putative transcriptional regulator [Streptomyces sp. MSC1_001]
MSVNSPDTDIGATDARRDLRIDLLGSVRARRGNEPLALGPVRRQAVLASLILRAPAFVTYQQLLDDVWGDEPPGTGHRVLPSYVYALRKALDEPRAAAARSVVRGGHGGYRLAADGVRTDLAELAEEAASAQRAKSAGDLDAALDHGSRALELLHGEPLPGLPGPFAEAQRQRLSQQRRALHLDRAECLVLLGRFPDALDSLLAAPVTQQYDEPFAALHMRALYGSGRQAEALSVYRETRRRLVDELGVEPGDELRRVHQALLHRDDPLLLGPTGRTRAATTVAAERTGSQDPPPKPPVPHGTGLSEEPDDLHDRIRPPTRRNDLPGNTACMVGRETELALLTAPVPTGAVSVMTVDGTAGVGKTALVVRAAWALADAHPDGCLFVDLHAHGSAHEQVAPQRALRRMLRAVLDEGDALPPPPPGPHTPAGEDDTDDLTDLVTAWRAATSALRLLLVVDNARSAEQVRPLIPAGPGSRVLVAGRQRLTGLDADLRLTVEPLGTGLAVELLRELLGRSRADSEPEAARELVRQCGGLPLALRIASARLQSRPSWSLAFLTDRMADGTGSSLDELRAEDRSVEAAFRVSYDQLGPELRRGFRALGTVPTARFDRLTLATMLGGSRQDAEGVLEDLVDASLLQQPQPGRYRLHDLVRAHARRVASEAPEEAAANRDAVLYLYTAAGRMASDWGPNGFPPVGDAAGQAIPGSSFTGWREASAWLGAAEGELVDVVAHAAAAGRDDHVCRIAEALVDHLAGQGHHHECRTTLELALTSADRATDPRMPAALRNCMGLVDVYQGRFRQASTWFTEALRYSRAQGDLREEARAIAGTGITLGQLGHPEEAFTRLSRAVELAAEVGDDWLTGVSHCNLGSIHHRQGRHEQALTHYDAALALAEKNDRPRMISSTLCFSAELQLALGRHAEAAHLLRRATELAGEVEDQPLRTATLSRLAAAEHGRGDLRSAVDLHHEALSTLTPRTSTWLEMGVRVRLGSTYTATGRRAEARREFRTALSLPGAGEHPREYRMAYEGLNSAGGHVPQPGAGTQGAPGGGPRGSRPPSDPDEADG